MKPRKTLFLLLSFCFLSIVNGSETAPVILKEKMIPDVSVYELLAAPERSQGHEICTVGVLKLAASERLSVLFPSLEARRFDLDVNGVVLSLKNLSSADSQGLDGKYVVLSGVFVTQSDEIQKALGSIHASLTRGRLLKVTKIRLWEPQNGHGSEVSGQH